MPRDSLRKGRVSLRNQVYHITACTHERAPLFAEFTCARLLVAEMRHLQRRLHIDSLAWVVMPDHVHWLFQLDGPLALSRVIKTLKGRSARSIALHLGRQTPIWQRGFHDRAIRHDEDLRAVARYIVANPLRAGLVTRIGDYPHWDAVWL